jgi:hypothetical protein
VGAGSLVLGSGGGCVSWTLGGLADTAIEATGAVIFALGQLASTPTAAPVATTKASAAFGATPEPKTLARPLLRTA